jgi:hypothetical protein
MSVAVHRSCAAFLALSLPVLVQGADVGFDYSVKLERAGAHVGFLKGFEKGDGLSLEVQLKQPSYVYIVTRAADGHFRLSYPEPRSAAGTSGPSEKLGPIKLVRMNEDPAVQRLYLIVSLVRLPELESKLSTADRAVPEALPLEVRDRYVGEGVYTRELKQGGILIRYKTARSEAVVVEEIALRRQ